jgi:hypothetical protein
MEDEIAPLTPNRQMADILMRQGPPKGNRFTLGSVPQGDLKSKFEAGLRAVVNGHISLRTLFRMFPSGVLPEGVTNSRLQDQLKLALAVNSMLEAERAPVTLKGAHAREGYEKYHVPDSFWPLNDKEKLDFIEKNGPPISLDLLNDLRRILGKDANLIEAYPSRYEPISPPKTW